MANPVGSLLVRIGGDTTDLDRALDRSVNKLGAWSGKTRNAINVAGKFAAAAGAAAAGGLAALTVSVANNQREMRNLAQLADTNVTQFAAMAGAAKKYGIEQDKLSDILKDTKDRVGDFIQTGGGPMADFFENIAPKVGVTADEFRRLSGKDALQLYVSSLEKANLSQADMTFYMEAVASDATALLPLLRENGKALAEQADQMERLNVALSQSDAAKIQAAGDAISDAQQALQGVKNTIAVELSPIVAALSKQFVDNAEEAEGFGDEVRTAVDGAVRGIGVMMDGLHGFQILTKGAGVTFQAVGSTILGILSEIYEGWSRIFEVITSGLKWAAEQANKLPWVNIRVTGLEELEQGFRSAAEQQQNLQDRMSDSLKQNVQELHDMLMQPLPSDQLQEWVDQARKAAEEAAKAMSGATGGDGSGGSGSDGESAEDRERREKQEKLREQLQDRLSALRDSYATEREMSMQKREEDLELLQESFENDLIKREEYWALIEQAHLKHEERITDIEDRARKERMREEAKAERQREKMWSDFHGNLSTIAQAGGEKLFNVSQTIGAAQAFIATVQGQAEALKLGWPQGLAAAAAIGAAGFQMVSTIKSATSSGGGGGSASVGAAGSLGGGSVNQATGGAGSGDGDASNNVILQISDDLTRSIVEPIMNEIGERLGDGGRLGSIRVTG